MTVKTLLNELSSADIAEYMANDQLNDNEYTEKLKAEMMTEDERNLKIKSLLGFK